MNIWLERNLMYVQTLRYLIQFMHTYRRAEKDPSYWLQVQKKNIRTFADYVYGIPFYRKRFDAAGIESKDIVTAEDFLKLPCLTKEEYREWCTEETRNHPDKYKGWLPCATSGSSGTPLSFYQLPRDRASEIANLFRGFLIQKKHFRLLFDSYMKVLSHRGISRNKNSLIQRLGFFRHMDVSAGDSVGTLVKAYNDFKPDVLYGTKSSFVRMIDYAETHGIALHHPKLIATIGDMLDDVSVGILAAEFGQNILFDMYGCTESGNMAVTKVGENLDVENRHYTIWNDTHVLNAIDDEGKLSDEGKLLVTPLYHFGFPLVNYALGDQVQLETLSGGVKGLRRIKGRENDKIFNRDGSYYIYSTIYQLMSNIEGVKQFRIVQKTYDDLLVYIVKTRQPVCSDETIKRVVSERAEKQFDMGAKNLSFEFVDELQPDSSGKMRMMISEIYGQK